MDLASKTNCILTGSSITNLVEDPKTLTTHLTSQSAPWSEVAGTYEMDFGKVIPYKRPGQKRDLLGSVGSGISSIGKDIGNGISGVAQGVDNGISGAASGISSNIGSLDVSKSVTFDIGAGTPGKVTNIFTDPDIKQRVKIDCVNCYTTGSFTLTGHVSVSLFSVKSLTLQGQPKGFAAELELTTTVAAVEKIDALSYTKELFAAGIPGAGIAITGIFHLGTTISYEVGVSTSVKGTAAFVYGLSAGVPDSAQITADIINPGSSSASGFEGGKITPNFDVTALSASVSAAAFSQPKLAFGIELTGVGTFDVAMVLKLPQVSATLSAAYNESGLCAQTPGSSKTGVQLTSVLAIEVDLNVDATLGSNKQPTFTKRLWSLLNLPLFSKCFPLNIPGLGPVGSSTKSSLPVPTSTASLTTLTKKPPTINTTVSVPTASPIKSTGTGPISWKPKPTGTAGTGGMPSPSYTGGDPWSSQTYGGPTAPYPTYTGGGPTGTGGVPYPTDSIMSSYTPYPTDSIMSSYTYPAGTAIVVSSSTKKHGHTGTGTGKKSPTGTKTSKHHPTGTGNATATYGVRRVRRAVGNVYV